MENYVGQAGSAEQYLLSIPAWTKKKHSLETVREYLDALGNPEQGRKLIHVAGTNGKGSVCADLSCILTTAGYRTGTFVSPHLVDIRERFLLDGEMISKEEFEAVFARVLAVVERLSARGLDHPTFFEFCFLIAMAWFEEKQAEFCVLEAGMGGRLDATNAVRKPLACVITSISLDHMQYLGNTVEQIAGEKAGIIKPGVPVIYDDNSAQASAVIAERAKELGVTAYPVAERDVEAYREEFSAAGFSAPYQYMDAALAFRTLEVLAIPGVDGAAARAGLGKVRWPGRMEEALPGIWLDGAHNPGGIRAFVDAVKEQRKQSFVPDPKISLLFAAVSDKDYSGMIRTLCGELPLAHVTVAHLQSGRTADETRLARLFLAAGCENVRQFSSVKDALESALSERQEGERLYVVGSLYLIGEVRQLICTLTGRGGAHD